jgi:hypothetical protein
MTRALLVIDPARKTVKRYERLIGGHAKVKMTHETVIESQAVDIRPQLSLFLAQPDTFIEAWTDDEPEAA